MPETRKELFDGKSLEEVADFMSEHQPNGGYDQAAKAEFLLRQTQFLERQALAAEQTARATAEYTRYMLWSVVILAGSSVLTLIVTLLKRC